MHLHLRQGSLLLALLMVPQSGCALMFTQAAPSNHASLAYFECDSSPGPAIVDTVVAAGLGALSFYLRSVMMDFDETGLDPTPFFIGSLVWTGLYAVSAGHGYYKVNACRGAKAALRTRILENAAP